MQTCASIPLYCTAHYTGAAAPAVNTSPSMRTQAMPSEKECSKFTAIDPFLRTTWMGGSVDGRMDARRRGGGGGGGKERVQPEKKLESCIPCFLFGKDTNGRRSKDDRPAESSVKTRDPFVIWYKSRARTM